MDHREIEALTGALAPVLRGFVASSLAPILERLAAAEARAPLKGDPGEPGLPGAAGKDADSSALEALQAEVLELRSLVSELTALAPVPGEKGEPGQPGKDAEPPSAEQIAAAVAKHLETNPPAPGAPGKDAAPVDRAQLAEAAETYLKANPPADGKDGESIKGEPGPAGRGIADALIGAAGDLIVTFTDGATKSVGIVTGKDGVDAKGEPGKDGKDALGFDDIEVIQDGERTFSLKFVRGDQTKTFGSFVIPAVIDRGVYRPETEYEKGDAVSFGGSIWIAQRSTKSKPEAAESADDWRLGVKRGRDGKDGVLVPAKPREPLSIR